MSTAIVSLPIELFAQIIRYLPRSDLSRVNKICYTVVLPVLYGTVVDRVSNGASACVYTLSRRQDIAETVRSFSFIFDDQMSIGFYHVISAALTQMSNLSELRFPYATFDELVDPFAPTATDPHTDDASMLAQASLKLKLCDFANYNGPIPEHWFLHRNEISCVILGTRGLLLSVGQDYTIGPVNMGDLPNLTSLSVRNLEDIRLLMSGRNVQTLTFRIRDASDFNFGSRRLHLLSSGNTPLLAIRYEFLASLPIFRLPSFLSLVPQYATGLAELWLIFRMARFNFPMDRVRSFRSSTIPGCHSYTLRANRGLLYLPLIPTSTSTSVFGD
jgi:hypothetical protein